MDVNINPNAIPQSAANDVEEEESLDSAQRSHQANVEESVIEPTQLLDHSHDDDDKGNVNPEQTQDSGQSGAPASTSSHAQCGGPSMIPLCSQTASSLFNSRSSCCAGGSLKLAKVVLEPKTTSQQQGASSSTSAGSLKKHCETHSEEDAASETSCLRRIVEDLPPEWNGLPSQEKRLTLKRMAEELESKAKYIRLFLQGSRPVSPA